MSPVRYALPLLLAATPALAHTGAGHAHGFAAGLAHPLLGLDHVLAMVAVGLWAGLTGGRAVFAYPAAFVATMILAAVAGMSGAGLPAMELGIAASVVALGAAVALRLSPPVAAGMAVCGAFAVFHGLAHGAEWSGGAGTAAYVAGFAVATAALHVVGIALGTTNRMAVPARVAGAAVAAAGLVILVA